MNKRHPPLVALMVAAMVLCWPALVWAQSSPNAWRTYNRFDGLNGSWFYAIVQSDDAIWAASDEGIARFNGVWQSFTSVPEAPQAPVLALAVDAQRQLWAVGPGGLARYDGAWHTSDAGRGLPHTAIFSLMSDAQGQLWAGGEAGVFVLPREQKQWQALEDSPVGVRLLAGDKDVWASDGSQLFLWRDGRWQQISLRWKKEPFTIHITALAPDGQQGVWLGSEQVGLLHVAADGTLSNWYRQESSALPSDYVTSLFVAEDGALWAGFNGGGVGILRRGQWQQLTNADGLAADFVTALFQDADGIFWFGTVAGISRYDPQSWQRWSPADNAPDAIVTSFSHDPAGRLWVTTHGQGLFRFDGRTWEHFGASSETPHEGLGQFLPSDYFDLVSNDANQFLPTNFLEASYVDTQGALWLGTAEAGVLRYAEGELQQWTTRDGLAGDTVIAIAQTPDGVMWFGTHRQGLSRWDGSTWQTITTTGKLTLDSVQALRVDTQGRLWVGTKKGVAVFDGQYWQSFEAGEGGPAIGEVMDMAEAPDGSCWVATWGGGVSRFSQGKWVTYTPQDGLLAPGVEAVWVTDKLAWFGTVSGLSLYDGLTWQAFGTANGYEVGRIYALTADEQEGVYLGTAHGVLRFQPDHTAPQILIQAVNGKAPESGLVEILPHEPVRVTLLGADMLTDTDELAYLYKLEGQDEDWRFARTPFITYPPLPEGRYHFSARARDASMNYSAPVELTITVHARPGAIRIPGLGLVRSEYALGIVALLTLAVISLGVSVWNVLARLAMRRKLMERRFNPYVAGSPIRDEKMFFGRESLLNDIEATLYHNNLIIQGERRIGKTSLLYQLRRRLLRKRDPEYRFIPILIDLEGAPEQEFFHRLGEGVLEALSESQLPVPAPETLFYHRLATDRSYTDRHFRRDLRTIIALLQQQGSRQPRLIFLLDEADILSTYDSLTQQQFRRILQDSFSQNIGVVLAGVRISKAWDRIESPWFNMFMEISIKPLNRQETEQLIREPVARFYEWDDDAMAAIWEKSKGRPHLIQQICLEAVNIMLDHNRHHITLKDVQRAHERVQHASHT